MRYSFQEKIVKKQLNMNSHEHGATKAKELIFPTNSRARKLNLRSLLRHAGGNQVARSTTQYCCKALPLAGRTPRFTAKHRALRVGFSVGKQVS